MTRLKTEFWLDDEKPDQKQLLTIIDGMKDERLFAQSIRFGLAIVERLQAHYKEKEGVLCYNLEKLIAPNDAALAIMDYLYDDSPLPQIPQVQREATSPLDDDFSDFNDTGFTSSDEGNFDAMFGQMDGFLD